MAAPDVERGELWPSRRLTIPYNPVEAALSTSGLQGMLRHTHPHSEFVDLGAQHRADNVRGRGHGLRGDVRLVVDVVELPAMSFELTHDIRTNIATLLSSVKERLQGWMVRILGHTHNLHSTQVPVGQGFHGEHANACLAEEAVGGNLGSILAGHLRLCFANVWE